MKFDWQQFIINGERYKLTDQASLVANPRSMFFAGEVAEPIQTAKKPIKKKTVITGDISLLLFMNPGANKGDISLGIDAASKFLLADGQVNKFDISYRRQWHVLGQELLPNIDIKVEVVIDS